MITHPHGHVQAPYRLPQRLRHSVRCFFRDLGDRLLELWLMTDIEPAEVVSGAGALIWLIVLSQPGDYMASAIRMHRLSDRAPEEAWAVAFAIIALYQSLALILSGMRGNHAPAWRPARIVGMVLAQALWVVVALLLLQDGLSIGGLYAMGAALGCMWGEFRLGLLIAVDRETASIRRIRNEARLESLSESIPPGPGHSPSSTSSGSLLVK